MNPVVQTSFSFGSIGEGTAVLVIGMLALLLFASIQMRNPTATAVWGIAVLMLILSGLLGLGSELFWLSILGVVVTLIAGIAVRVQS